jgi:hypothetical protein
MRFGLHWIFPPFTASAGTSNATQPSDPAAAFATYQRVMGDYVAAGMQLPPGGVAAFAPRTRAMIRLRALSTRAIRHWPMRTLFARQFGKADAITLPDYPTRVQSR